MRVLISGYVCDPFGGSEGANTWFTAYELARAGASVHIVTRTRDQVPLDPCVAAARAQGLAMEVEYLSDEVPGSVSRSRLGVYARYLAFQQRVAQRVRGQALWDVAHHVSWGSINHPVGLAGKVHPLVLGPAGGGQLLVPELVTWMDGPTKSNRARNLGVRCAGLNPWTRQLVRHSDVILVANEESRALVDRLGARRVELMLPEGVRGAPAVELPTGNDATVVWLGRFLPIKAAGVAVTAFRQVLTLVPQARLVFVGDGPTRPRIEAEARDLVSTGQVVFMGERSWEQAQQILAGARVHLFTGLRDSSSAQTIEAAALGIPTVGLDSGGLRAFCSRPGFRLVAASPGAGLPTRFASAITELMTLDNADWLSESAAARAFAEELSFEQRAQALLRLYADL